MDVANVNVAGCYTPHSETKAEFNPFAMPTGTTDAHKKTHELQHCGHTKINDGTAPYLHHKKIRK